MERSFARRKVTLASGILFAHGRCNLGRIVVLTIDAPKPGKQSLGHSFWVDPARQQLLDHHAPGVALVLVGEFKRCSARAGRPW